MFIATENYKNDCRKVTLDLKVNVIIFYRLSKCHSSGLRTTAMNDDVALLKCTWP